MFFDFIIDLLALVFRWFCTLLFWLLLGILRTAVTWLAHILFSIVFVRVGASLRWLCYGGRRSYIILLVAGLVQSSGQPLAYYQHRPYPSFPPFVIVFRAIKRGGYTLIYKLPHLWVINNAFAIA
jgi:hypothetical protein